MLPIVTQGLYDFAPENGLDPEHTHQLFKEWFLPKVVEPPKINLPNGEIRKGVYSTTKLTTSEFMDYLSLIDVWCQEFGIVVPPPNANWRLEEQIIDIDKL